MIQELTPHRVGSVARVVVGSFFNDADSAYHGYILSKRVFTQYDIAGAIWTYLYGINDAGYIVGSFRSTAVGREGFLDVAGAVECFSVGSSSYTDANSINASKEVVGDYVDSSTSTYHGFFRGGNGSLTFPLDFPGSGQTKLLAINNKDLVVGWHDSHGLLLKLPDKFVSFDYSERWERSSLGSTMLV